MRKRNVTRTIKTTTVTVLVADIEAESTLTESIAISQQYADEKKLFKAVKAYYDSIPTKSPIKIKDSQVQETVYSMSENDFIRYATDIGNERNEKRANKAESED